MKVLAFLFAFLAVASAFAPASVSSRSSTELSALFDDVRYVRNETLVAKGIPGEVD